MRSTWITLLVPFLGSCAFAQLDRVGYAAMTTAPDSGLEVRQLSCPAGNTACADGDGCCPIGAACTRSRGQGLCATNCNGGPTCTNGPVKACCPLGLYCNPTGTLCLTDAPFTVPSITAPSLSISSFSVPSFSVPTFGVPSVTGIPSVVFPTDTQTATRTTAATTSRTGTGSPLITPAAAAAPIVAAPLDGWVPRLIGGLAGLLLIG